MKLQWNFLPSIWYTIFAGLWVGFARNSRFGGLVDWIGPFFMVWLVSASVLGGWLGSWIIQRLSWKKTIGVSFILPVSCTFIAIVASSIRASYRQLGQFEMDPAISSAFDFIGAWVSLTWVSMRVIMTYSFQTTWLTLPLFLFATSVFSGVIWLMKNKK